MDKRIIAGVDEAGRGPWAGPVVAAAVILNEPIPGLKDSKLLSTNKRTELALMIQQKAAAWGIGSSSPDEIDQLNVLQATLLAMVRAIKQLDIIPDQILIDGNIVPNLKIPAKAIIKGDKLIPSISAASIIAKVYRDQLMCDYEKQYPGYRFAKHKGYGTVEHLQALTNLGVTPIHRKTFRPVKNFLQFS